MSTLIESKKLQKLADIEAFGDVYELLEDACLDSVCPGICCNPDVPDCDFTAEYEPDQDQGWCEACDKGTVKSALILAGVI